MPVYPGALEISFAIEISNLAIRSAGNRTHGPYTIPAGCGKPCKEARNFTKPCQIRPPGSIHDAASGPNWMSTRGVSSLCFVGFDGIQKVSLAGRPGRRFLAKTGQIRPNPDILVGGKCLCVVNEDRANRIGARLRAAHSSSCSGVHLVSGRCQHESSRDRDSASVEVARTWTPGRGGG